jgi:hypothetical protein
MPKCKNGKVMLSRFNAQIFLEAKDILIFKKINSTKKYLEKHVTLEKFES